MWKKIKPYVISCAFALGVGALSALLTMGNMDLYSNINQPPLAPPAIVFPIVWTILYILMGISAAIIFTNRSKNRIDADNGLLVYGLSLILNFFWSIIFFNLRAFLFSFIWLIVLWGTILATILLYRKVNKLAAYLQIPYLLWVTFAGYLNFSIYLLN